MIDFDDVLVTNDNPNHRQDIGDNSNDNNKIIAREIRHVLWKGEKL